jgi:tetratricopeptide (TPR) repeat protein
MAQKQFDDANTQSQHRSRGEPRLSQDELAAVPAARREPTYDYAQTEVLALARRRAGLSQDGAAEFFHLTGRKRRDTVSAWELGYSRPQLRRRTEFMLYLLDELNLRHDPEQFRQIWDEVMVGQWGWKPLSKDELARAGDHAPQATTRPPPAITARPFQLPPPLHTFVRRSGLQEALGRLLLPGKGMVALHGTAGVGKSVIAVNAAHDWEKRFRDGVLWLDLRRQQDVAPALRRIAAAYGYAHKADSTEDPEELAAIVRTILQDREALIVLDNVEEIQPEQFKLLLPGASKCVTLVTSRRLFPQLSRYADVLQVDSMDQDDAGALLATILGRVASADEKAARRQLVSRLGGLPLALDIAARRMQAQRWSAAQMLDRLAGAEQAVAALALPLAEDDRRDSVAEAFASSYALLDPELQRIFRALAVMAGGGFSARGAAAVLELQVWAFEPRLEALGHLALARPAAGSGRWELHPLLRDYGEALARSAGEWEALKNRHLAHFVDYARQATRDFYALEEELPDLMQAARWSWQSGEHDGLLRLVEWLHTGGGRFLELQGHTGEAIQLLGWTIEIDRQRGDRHSEARHLRDLGVAYKRRGLRSQALAQFEAAHALQSELGDRSETAACLNAIGEILILQGRSGEAFHKFEEALAIRQELGDEAGIGSCLMNMGIEYRRRGQPDEARAEFEKALGRFERLDEQEGLARCLLNLGNCYRNQGEPDQAMACYDRSLAISRQLGDREGIAICLYQQGIILLGQDNRDAALKNLKEALAMSQAMGDLWGEALAREVIGEVYGQMNKLEPALKHLNKALAMARELGDRPLEEECLKYIEQYDRKRVQPK